MSACLAGNSIHADKTFLVKEMPEVSPWTFGTLSTSDEWVCLWWLLVLLKFLPYLPAFLSLSSLFSQLIDHLHYRLVDVSTIKELVRRFYGGDKENFWNKGKGSHRALDDIRDSIEELKFYKENYFKDKKEIGKWGCGWHLPTWKKKWWSWFSSWRPEW